MICPSGLPSLHIRYIFTEHPDDISVVFRRASRYSQIVRPGRWNPASKSRIFCLGVLFLKNVFATSRKGISGASLTIAAFHSPLLQTLRGDTAHLSNVSLSRCIRNSSEDKNRRPCNLLETIESEQGALSQFQNRKRQKKRETSSVTIVKS